MATRNICTYPLESALGKEANAIIEQNGKLKRVNLDWEFDKKASAIVSDADGEVIAVKDSATARAKNIRLFGKSTQKSTTGKNLFKVTAPETYNGVTLSKKDDYYVLNGTATASALFITKIGALEAGTYALSANNPKHNSLGQISVPIVQVYSSTTLESIAAIDDAVNKTSIVTIKGGENYETRIRIQEGITYDNFIIKPQFERNSVVTEYEPYTGGAPSPRPDWPQEIVSVDNPEIKVYGKNILMLSDRKSVEFADASNTAKRSFDGKGIILGFAYNNYCIPSNVSEWNVSETALTFKTNNIAYGIGFDVKVLPNTTYTVSFEKCSKPISFMAITEYDSEGKFIGYPNFESANLVQEFTTSENTAWIVLSFQNRNEDMETSAISYENIMLAVGSCDGIYEVPKEEQEIELTHTLHGIPVKSGGNYTDADGQQWICDEIDLERGVYVQRIKELVLNGSESWGISGSTYIYLDLEEHAIKGGEGFCSHFDFWYNYGGDCIFATEKWLYIGKVLSDKYGLNVAAWKEFLAENNMVVVYQLATPIETPLTDAEIYAFKHTEMNYPNTTIFNDAGAFMKLDYFADTKKFIVNYLKENGMSVHSPARISEVSLPASGWVGDKSPYSQVVNIDGSTKYSQVDLTPSVTQLATFYEKDLCFVTENHNGVLTVYAIGQRPLNDYNIQVTITEVAYG